MMEDSQENSQNNKTIEQTKDGNGNPKNLALDKMIPIRQTNIETHSSSQGGKSAMNSHHMIKYKKYI